MRPLPSISLQWIMKRMSQSTPLMNCRWGLTELPPNQIRCSLGLWLLMLCLQFLTSAPILSPSGALPTTKLSRIGCMQLELHVVLFSFCWVLLLVCLSRASLRFPLVMLPMWLFLPPSVFFLWVSFVPPMFVPLITFWWVKAFLQGKKHTR